MSARRRSILSLRHIFRHGRGPSGLDFAALAIGLAAATVIVVSLIDVTPARLVMPPAISIAPSLAPPPAPIAQIVLDSAPATFAPRLLPQSAPQEIDVAPPEPALPKTPGPAWLRFAAAAPASAGQPVIAIILDDMGLDRKRSERAVLLDAPLTLSYLPYARKLAGQTAAARLRGHELMVHLPMEPLAKGENPGPRALLTGLSDDELVRRLEWALNRFTGFVGVNNHMGSRLTRNSSVMALVMGRLKARGLLFVDSRTSIRSVATAAARLAQVPHAERHIFLDHVDSLDAIQTQLETLERVARRQGYAVAIGHPRDATVQALDPWMAGARARGFVFVPISAIVRGAYSLG
jgi:uncharacterized protein